MAAAPGVTIRGFKIQKEKFMTTVISGVVTLKTYKAALV